MKKSKFTEEQIAYALRQVEGDVCRQLGSRDLIFASLRGDRLARRLNATRRSD
jgi:hypothetical protein